MRIVRLGITNFRCIGASEAGGHPVNLEVDDNNLIFLCGKNNSGKSTVLAAYEMFVVASREADLQDFFQKEPSNHIVIEASVRAETEEDRAHQALAKLWDENGVARIRKTWSGAGQKGEKESFDPTTAKWKEGGAGGFDTLLQNACPTPVWIRGTSTPDEVLALLRTLVQETILKNIANEQVYVDAVAAIQNLDSAITQNEYAASLQKNLNSAIAAVFPRVSFAIRNDGAKDVTELFKSTATIEIREDQRPGLGLANHGHGVRRQFIMSAFRGLALQFEEVRKAAKQRKAENYQISDVVVASGTAKSRMLLVEEPELFLHPSAARSVRDLLFVLASSSEFQVMAATHSPVVIDLARPHTTLARVCAADKGTVLHQVSSTLFSADERETMKMLNYFDPYVCEAFFSSKVVLVEGDTEAVAIRELLARMQDESPNQTLDELHVVNCGTKMNIPFFQKVLTHFRIDHFVLHDMDAKLSAKGSKSPAWTLNERIWEMILIARADGVAATRYVFETEFESANGYVLDETVGKPFSAFREAAKWKLDDDSKAAVRFVRHMVSGKALEPEFTQEALEKLAR